MNDILREDNWFIFNCHSKFTFFRKHKRRFINIYANKKSIKRFLIYNCYMSIINDSSQYLVWQIEQ